MADATREQPVHKVVVCTPGDLPGQLDAGVPGIKHLVSHAISQLPKVSSDEFPLSTVRLNIILTEVFQEFSSITALPESL